jgi:hypothetical protein
MHEFIIATSLLAIIKGAFWDRGARMKRDPLLIGWENEGAIARGYTHY